MFPLLDPDLSLKEATILHKKYETDASLPKVFLTQNLNEDIPNINEMEDWSSNERHDFIDYMIS